MANTQSFNKRELSIIKKLYDGNWSSVRYIANMFGVSVERIKWATNHRNIQKRVIEYVKNFRKRNPIAAREINRRSANKYYHTENGKRHILAANRRHYYKDHEKTKRYYRERYQLNKLNTN